MKKILVVLGFLSLSACTTTLSDVKCPDPIKREVTLNEKEYAPYEAKGTAKIQGRVCVTNVLGKRECPADQRVILNPVTAYSTEWYRKAWKGSVALEPPHATALKHNRIIQTDAKGYFEFKDLPAGNYYVVAEVCPPCAKAEKEAQKPSNLMYERLGAKVSVKKHTKADLKKVYPLDPPKVKQPNQEPKAKP